MFITSLLSGAIQCGTSVLYGIYGETVTERVGVINLGTEGCMVVGALAAYVCTYHTKSPLLGILMAAIGGGVLALLHAILVIGRKANQLATGLTIMFLGLGLTSFLGQQYVSVSIDGLSMIPIPVLSGIPVIGTALFNQDILVYVSYILCPLLCYLLFKTRLGLLLRATGEDEEVVFAYGANPKLLRYIGVVLGGMISAIGGAQLAIAYTHTWIEKRSWHYRGSSCRACRISSEESDDRCLHFRWRTGVAAFTAGTGRSYFNIHPADVSVSVHNLRIVLCIPQEGSGNACRIKEDY